MKISIVLFLFLSVTSCAILGQNSKKALVEKCGFLPHCVSSKDERKRFKIDEYKFEGSMHDFKIKVLGYLKGQKRVEIISVKDNYIHATYTSKLMKFVDDVEFEFSKGSLHIRSISRIGISDAGVNRKRVNKIHNDLKNLK